MFEILKECEFKEVRSDLNISQNLSKLFEAAQNVKDKQYISAAPENRRRNLFDSITNRKVGWRQYYGSSNKWARISKSSIIDRILVEKDAATPD